MDGNGGKASSATQKYIAGWWCNNHLEKKHGVRRWVSDDIPSI